MKSNGIHGINKLISTEIQAGYLQLAQPHPRMDEVVKEVDDYFLRNWPFPDDNARAKFVAVGFSRCACLSFPKALDDRIHHVCKLLTALFLVDDLLENMSLREGERYNSRLMDLSRGDVLPNRSIAAEFIIFDLWESMRAHDLAMANDILEPMFVFMRAQTDPVRLKAMNIGEHLGYRERDMGKVLLGALMRYSMALKISPEELELASHADTLCSRHMSVVNDIWSYEKEYKASQNAHGEGGMLCSCVHILARDTGLEIPATKRILYSICRKWELEYSQQLKHILDKRDSPALRAYLDGLELGMAGNEAWCKTTPRYVGED